MNKLFFGKYSMKVIKRKLFNKNFKSNYTTFFN